MWRRTTYGLAVAATLVGIIILISIWDRSEPESRQSAPPHTSARDRHAGPETKPSVTKSSRESASTNQPLLHDAPPLVMTDVTQSRVASPDHCLSECGAPCVSDTDGHLHCGLRCFSDGDCTADTMCFPTLTGIARCTVSQCDGVGKDNDCPQGFTCLPVTRASAAIFICAKAGPRLAGESCLGIGTAHSAEEGLCAARLLCENGVCLPASCSSDTDCPNGARCLTDSGGLLTRPKCVSSCERDSDCAHGLKCVDTGLEHRVCGDIKDASCLISGCAKSLRCTTTVSRLDHLIAECMKSCSDDSRNCGIDELCQDEGFGESINRVCIQKCDSDADCGIHKRCINDGTQSTCRYTVDGMGKLVGAEE